MKQKICQQLVCGNCIEFFTQRKSSDRIGVCAVKGVMCHQAQPFCDEFRLDWVLTSDQLKALPKGLCDTGLEYVTI